MSKLKTKRALTARHYARSQYQQVQVLERVAKSLENSIECLSDALYGVADSLDFIASESPNNAVFNRLTDKESKVIYEALKKNYLDGMKIEPSGEHHDIAMSRIEHIASGRCFHA